MRYTNVHFPPESQVEEYSFRAIDEGGTTLSDGAYQQADGSAGEFARRLAVYGREGEPCPRCGAEIERVVVGQRGTFVCGECQVL